MINYNYELERKGRIKIITQVVCFVLFSLLWLNLSQFRYVHPFIRSQGAQSSLTGYEEKGESKGHTPQQQHIKMSPRNCSQYCTAEVAQSSGCSSCKTVAAHAVWKTFFRRIFPVHTFSLVAANYPTAYAHAWKKQLPFSLPGSLFSISLDSSHEFEGPSSEGRQFCQGSCFPARCRYRHWTWTWEDTARDPSGCGWWEMTQVLSFTELS